MTHQQHQNMKARRELNGMDYGNNYLVVISILTEVTNPHVWCGERVLIRLKIIFKIVQNNQIINMPQVN
jgi:hypothetical protein